MVFSTLKLRASTPLVILQTVIMDTPAREFTQSLSLYVHRCAATARRPQSSVHQRANPSVVGVQYKYCVTRTQYTILYVGVHYKYCVTRTQYTILYGIPT